MQHYIQNKQSINHNKIRDAISLLGMDLGLNTRTEYKFANGSRADVIWIENVGKVCRLKYVFEVQSKGSIKSLLVNLSKAAENPTVLYVIAVSDKDQLEKIEMQAKGMTSLTNKLLLWEYGDMLETHKSLQRALKSLKKLGMHP